MAAIQVIPTRTTNVRTAGTRVSRIRTAGTRTTNVRTAGTDQTPLRLVSSPSVPLQSASIRGAGAGGAKVIPLRPVARSRGGAVGTARLGEPRQPQSAVTEIAPSYQLEGTPVQEEQVERLSVALVARRTVGFITGLALAALIGFGAGSVLTTDDAGTEAPAVAQVSVADAPIATGK